MLHYLTGVCLFFYIPSIFRASWNHENDPAAFCVRVVPQEWQNHERPASEKPVEAGRRGKCACPLVLFFNNSCGFCVRHSAALNARAAFMWRRTNGRRDEWRPRWALHPSTQRPIEWHIRLIIKFPVVSKQTERGVSRLRPLGLITFLSSFTSSNPSWGPRLLPLVALGRSAPPAAHTIPTYFMTAVLFLPELHRESFFVAQEFLWTRNRRLGYKTWGRCDPNCSPTPAADAGMRSIGFWHVDAALVAPSLSPQSSSEGS